ncbi:GMC family oxidoreductase N-terminal domain-containing protein [Actinomadura sp. NAK00032]|uniref:GMC family oxidoreductase N-terminal domain-containing protein n=1 Tax=Actinomadura sp. NAK00032 TaxID=2742128 RepID=UPI0020C79FDF|nr:GMC family oxidoreductase N-terminal domain-containing protein [Actinomadura sp. NAK00032]
MQAEVVDQRVPVAEGVTSSRTDEQPQAPYWRGRGAGGSSSVNGQIAILPPVEDFAHWAAAGCGGWSPEDVLPYFARLEDDEEFGAEPYHGRGGPTPIFRMPRERWGGADGALAAAALAAGHAWAPDVNAPGAAGVSPYPINSRDGRRPGNTPVPGTTFRGRWLPVRPGLAGGPSTHPTSSRRCGPEPASNAPRKPQPDITDQSSTAPVRQEVPTGAEGCLP